MPAPARNKESKSLDSMSKLKPGRGEVRNVFIGGLVLLLIALWLFFAQGTEGFFWFFFVVGLIISANAVWLWFGFSMPFIIKYGITMLRTRHFVNFIKGVAHHAKWFEYVCILGVFVGFGIAGIDYWFARKLSKGKRIAVLLVSAVVLGGLFYFLLNILFKVPILQPLFWPSLVGFVFLGFGGMSLVILLGYGFISLESLFIGKNVCPSVAPVIPGAPIPGLGVPIPLIAWISLALVLILHELSHGIMMAYFKEKIKSVGLLMAGVFPIGAFVEQDDRTFEELDERKRLLVLSAGSAMNIFCVLVAVVLLFGASIALQPLDKKFEAEYAKTFGGVKVNAVQEKVSFCGNEAEAPAKGKLFAEDVVKSINGVDVNSISVVTQEFAKAKNDINFTVSRLNPDTNTPFDVNVTIAPHNFEDLGIRRIGVEFGTIQTGYVVPQNLVLEQAIIVAVLQILFFFGLLSFAAGSFNYFPSDPFDGGRMAKIMLVPYFGFMKFKSKKETQKFIGRLFIWLLILALALNMIPYLTLLF